METSAKSESSYGALSDAQGDYQYQAVEHVSSHGVGKELELWKVAFGQRKWITLLCVAISLVLAILFWAIYPPTLTAEVELTPVGRNENELVKYQEYIDINAKMAAKDETRLQLAVNVSSLLGAFIRSLEDRSVFTNQLEEMGFKAEKSYRDEEHRRRTLEKEAFKVSLIKPDPEELRRRSTRLNEYWRVKYSGKMSETEIRDFIYQSLTAANTQTKSDLNKQFDIIVKIQKENKERSISELKRIITLTVSKFETDVKRRMLALNEQAAIARSLGIAKNTLESQIVGSSDQILAIPQDKVSPLYYRGYEALEKELNLIGTRGDLMDFAPDISSLENQIRDLETDPMLDQLEAAFQKTPLVTGEFKAVEMHYFGIRVDEGPFRIAVVSGLFILGLFIAFLIVAARRFSSPA